MGARPLYVVRLKLNPEHEEAFNQWYNREYLDPMRPIAPLFVNIYRHVAGEGDNKTYLTIYEIKDEASIDEALGFFDLPERQEARRQWKEWSQKAVREIEADTFHAIYP